MGGILISFCHRIRRTQLLDSDCRLFVLLIVFQFGDSLIWGGNAEALFFKSIGPWLGSKDLLSTAMVWRSQGSERGTQHRFVYAFEWWPLTILMTRSQYLAFILPSNPNAFALVSIRAGVEAHRAALHSSLNQWVTGRTSCFDLRLNLVTWLYQALTLF